jgi:hypothetical protein
VVTDIELLGYNLLQTPRDMVPWRAFVKTILRLGTSQTMPSKSDYALQEDLYIMEFALEIQYE